MHPPYVSYDENLVYPVLIEEAAKGGALNISHTQKLTIEFNCMGVEVKNTLILHIKIPLHSPIDLYIDKECSKGNEKFKKNRNNY